MKRQPLRRQATAAGPLLGHGAICKVLAWIRGGLHPLRPLPQVGPARRPSVIPSESTSGQMAPAPARAAAGPAEAGTLDPRLMALPFPDLKKMCHTAMW